MNLTISTATKHRAGVHAVRTDRFKLVFDERTGATSLFDLVSDPGEYRDLAPTKSAESSRLLALLSSHIAKAKEAALPPESASIEEETRKRLESLGYLTETPSTKDER